MLSASAALLVVHAARNLPQPGKLLPKGTFKGRLRHGSTGKVKSSAPPGEPGVYRTLTISPDGKRIAVERADPPTQNQTQNRDIWVLEIASGKTLDSPPTPPGRRFRHGRPMEAASSSHPTGPESSICTRRLLNGAGTEELLYKSSDGKGATSWSPDGRFLLYYSLGQPTHVKLLAASGPADRTPVPVVDPQFTSITARFSPDGRWIVYTSNESGTNEVSVRPFDPATGTPGEPIVLTSGGGRTPLWRGDGKEIFYLGPDGMVMAIEVNTAAGFKAGTPKPLFKAPEAVAFWDAMTEMAIGF